MSAEHRNPLTVLANAPNAREVVSAYREVERASDEEMSVLVVDRAVRTIERLRGELAAERARSAALAAPSPAIGPTPAPPPDGGVHAHAPRAAGDDLAALEHAARRWGARHNPGPSAAFADGLAAKLLVAGKAALLDAGAAPLLRAL